MCARYPANPKESNLAAVRNVIKYVKGTSDLGLWFTKETNSKLVGYSDVDWVGNPDDRKSTSGGCFFFGNNLVSWFSKSRIASHSLLLKLGTLQLGVAALN